MATIDTIRRITIQATTQGVDQATASLDRLGDAQQTVATVSEQTARATVSVERAYERLRLSTDQAYRAQVQFAKGQEVINRALDQRVIDETQAANSLALLNQRYNQMVPAATGAARATSLNSAAMANLNFQLQDIFVSLSSGQSPFTVLVQQGSQISQIFAANGGLAVGLRSIGTSIANVGTAIGTFLVTPVGAAVAAFGTLTAVAAAYVYSAGNDIKSVGQILEEHEEDIKGLREAYNLASEGAEDYGQRSTAAMELGVRQGARDLKATLQSELTDAFTGLVDPVILELSKVDQAIERTSAVIPEFAAFAQPIMTLYDEMAAGNPNLEAFEQHILAIAKADPSGALDPLAHQLTEIFGETIKTAQAMEEFEGTLNELTSVAGDLANVFDNLPGVFGSLASALDLADQGILSIRAALPGLAEGFSASAESAMQLGENQLEVNQILEDAAFEAQIAGMNDYDRQVAEINHSLEEQIETLENLGATDAQVNQARAAAAAQLNALYQEQQEAIESASQSFLRAGELAQAENDFQRQTMELEFQTQDLLDQLVEMGASQDQLLAVEQSAAAQMEALISQQTEQQIAKFDQLIQTSQETGADLADIALKEGLTAEAQQALIDASLRAEDQRNTIIGQGDTQNQLIQAQTDALLTQQATLAEEIAGISAGLQEDVGAGFTDPFVPNEPGGAGGSYNTQISGVPGTEGYSGPGMVGDVAPGADPEVAGWYGVGDEDGGSSAGFASGGVGFVRGRGRGDGPARIRLAPQERVVVRTPQQHDSMERIVASLARDRRRAGSTVHVGGIYINAPDAQTGRVAAMEATRQLRGMMFNHRTDRRM